MKKKWLKRMIVAALSAACVSTAVAGGASVASDDELAVSAATTTTFDKGNIVLTVGVITDPHIGYVNTAYTSNESKLQTALSRLQFFGGEKLNAEGTKASSLDALVSAGDNTQNGTADEAKAFIETLKTATRSSGVDVGIDPTVTPVIAAHGNHDVYWSGCMDRSAFYDVYNGLGMYTFDKDLEAAKLGNRHVEVKGYHFLTVDIATYQSGYNTLTDTTEAWLEEKLATISEGNPGEPIFVISHSPAMNTIYGSIKAEAGYGDITTDDATADWGASVELDNILKNYPQVINISGHTHYASNHDLSIMQTSYTSFTPGGCGDLAANKDTAETASGVMPNARTYSQSALIQVDQYGNVMINRIDNIKNAEIGDKIIIPAPKADGSHLEPYSYKRGETNAAPTFASNEKLTLTENSTTNVTVTYPKASDDGVVYSYRITLKDELDNALSTVTTLAPWVDYPDPSKIPETDTYTFDGVTAADIYKLEVVAIDCWNKESDPLVKITQTPHYAFTNYNGTTVKTQDDGYIAVNNLSVNGTTLTSSGYARFNNYVTLDGLTVSFYSTSVAQTSAGGYNMVGFYLSNPNNGVNTFPSLYADQDANGKTVFAVSGWQGLYGSQNRLHFAYGYDYGSNATYANSALVYRDEACTKNGFMSSASSHVSTFTEGEKVGYTVSFNSYNDFVYAVTVKMTYGSMWTSNSLYDAETQTSTVFLPKSALASVLENGKARLYFMGKNASTMYVKVEDKGTQERNVDYSYEGTNGLFGGYSYASASLSANYGEDGYTTLAGFAGYTAQATRFTYKRKMALDGLSVTMKFTTNTGTTNGGAHSGDAMGFILTGDNTGNVWYGYNSNFPSITASQFAVTNWTSLYSGQDRLQIATSHEYTIYPIIYKEAYTETLHTGTCSCPSGSACEQRRFGSINTHTYVANHKTTNEYTVTFRVYNDDWYSITIDCPNRYSGQTATKITLADGTTTYRTTVYLPKTALADIVDDEGNVYVVFGGFTSGSDYTSSMDVKVSNAKIDEWQEKYAEAVESGADALTIARYKAALTDAGFAVQSEVKQSVNAAITETAATQEAMVGFNKTVSMTVSSDLIVNEYVYVPTASGATSVTATFTHNGETYELPLSASSSVTETYTFADPITGTTETSTKTFTKYKFAIDTLTPQCMADTITMNFVAYDKDGNVLVDTTVENWSMKSYLESLIAANTSTELTALATALLNYGAAAQEFKAYNTDALANENYVSTVDTSGTAFTDSMAGAIALERSGETVNFTAARLILDNKVVMCARFTADAEYAKSLTAKVSIGGNAAETVDIQGSNGTYYLYLYDIMPTQYDETVTFTVYDGENAVATLTYSVNTYVKSKYDQPDASNAETYKNANLTKALWAVGYSAKAYAGS